MKKTFWIWEMLVLLLIAGGGWLASGDLSIYLDAASASLILLLPVIVIFTSFKPREIGRHFKNARTQDTSFTELQSSLGFFEQYQRIILLATLLPLFIGGVSMLRLGFGIKEGPNFSMIGTSLSIMLISVTYGLSFMVLVTLPRIGALKKRLAEFD